GTRKTGVVREPSSAAAAGGACAGDVAASPAEAGSESPNVASAATARAVAHAGIVDFRGSWVIRAFLSWWGRRVLASGRRSWVVGACAAIAGWGSKGRRYFRGSIPLPGVGAVRITATRYPRPRSPARHRGADSRDRKRRSHVVAVGDGPCRASV